MRCPTLQPSTFQTTRGRVWDMTALLITGEGTDTPGPALSRRGLPSTVTGCSGREFHMPPRRSFWVSSTPSVIQEGCGGPRKSSMNTVYSLAIIIALAIVLYYLLKSELDYVKDEVNVIEDEVLTIHREVTHDEGNTPGKKEDTRPPHDPNPAGPHTRPVARPTLTAADRTRILAEMKTLEKPEDL